MLIKKVTIENFKSITKMDLPLGRVNVLIGANGAGKSNILEAIAIGAAAAGNQLNNEYLAPRGIRIPDDLRFIASGFKEVEERQDITVRFDRADEKFTLAVMEISDATGFPQLRNKLEELFPSMDSLGSALQELKRIGASRLERNPNLAKKDPEGLSKEERDTAARADRYVRVLNELFGGPESLRNFLIYSPEYFKLRTFEAEGQIVPLGAGGEGLFRLLRVIAAKDPTVIDQIKEKLAVVGWFEDFVAPENDDSLERALRIKDRYLHEDLSFFNQKSANEGFLFLLFYYCLFLSSFTPSFFAIDNVDASLNPRLCVRLMKDIAEMAKANDKQVILTTHNPAILDGLNLADDEQRLFSVYRSATGETQLTRILPQKDVPGTKPVRLSEAFVKGYLGGLPDSF